MNKSILPLDLRRRVMNLCFAALAIVFVGCGINAVLAKHTPVPVRHRLIPDLTVRGSTYRISQKVPA